MKLQLFTLALACVFSKVVGIKLARRKKEPLNLIIQVDESKSMLQEHMFLKKAAPKILKFIYLATGGNFKVGIVGFGGRISNSQARVLTPLTSSYEDLKIAIMSVTALGGKEPGLRTILQTAEDKVAGGSLLIPEGEGYCAVMITDEESDPNPDTRPTPEKAVAGVLKAGGKQFILSRKGPSMGDYRPVAQKTGAAAVRLGKFRRNRFEFLKRFIIKCCGDSYVRGDPHFKTWAGRQFDFHGGCDLVFLSNPGFANGLGMDIHVRSKNTERWLSYVETAVVRIGDETLEVSGADNKYWINGVEGEELNDGDVLQVSGYVVNTKRTDTRRKFYIDLGNGETVAITTFKDFVNVEVDASPAEDNFDTSRGLMGTYPDGDMLGRDGVTIFNNDTDAFGQDWQVRPTDPQLFHSYSGNVQYPQKCHIPNAEEALQSRQRRRLGEMITKERAEKACENIAQEERENCVFDVMQSNDLDLVALYEGLQEGTGSGAF